jgi:aspartyl-tRNA(Asn)/glutamyl-tRNA(Gln) amidotransferase subunit B
VDAGAPAAAARAVWLNDLARRANDAGTDPADLPVTPAAVAELLALVEDGTLTNRMSREVLDGVLAGEGSPAEVVETRGLRAVSDTGALTTAVDEAIAANPDVAAKVRGGKVAAIGALIGPVMKATRGQADASVVRTLLLERLGVEG